MSEIIGPYTEDKETLQKLLTLLDALYEFKTGEENSFYCSQVNDNFRRIGLIVIGSCEYFGISASDDESEIHVKDMASVLRHAYWK